MKIDTQRFIDRWVGVPILALLSLVDGLRRPTPRSEPRSILIILLSEMGSLVCAQPMILSLKQRYPGAQLSVLVLHKNRGVVELLGEFAQDRIYTLNDRDFRTFLSTTWQTLRALRRNGVDVVIDCELFARISAALSWASGAPVRVGFDRMKQEGLYRGSIVNCPVPYNPYLHISHQFLALAGAIESTSTPRSKAVALPERISIERLVWPAAVLDALKARLLNDFCVLATRKLVLLYAGAGILPIRGWPLERFAAVAQALVADGYAVGMIGLPEDRPLGARIQAVVGTDAVINLAGYTASLQELVQLFHHAELLISNDGGPGHFAALTPLPVVSLFGPETPLLYAPLCERGESLFRRLPCAPCLSAYNHRATACDGANYCLQAIEVADVLAAARRWLPAVSG